MKNPALKHRGRRGFILVIVLGVLAVVAMIATSFAMNMQLEYKASVNYLNSARATAIAQAGIDKVIADIRGWAAGSNYSAVLTNIDSYSTAETALGNGSYQITIGDTGYKREEQKININALDQTDSPWIDLLLGAGLTVTDVGRLIDYRDPDTAETTQLLRSTGVVNVTGLGSNETGSKNAPYATAEELRLVLNNDTKYNAIKNMVTVYAPILKGGLIGRYYSDQTFDKNTIFDLLNYNGKVIELGQIRQPMEQNVGGIWGPWLTMPGADGLNDGWDEAHDTSFAGAYIATNWSSGLFQLDKFGVIWTGYIYIPDAKAGQNITFKVRSQQGYRFIIDNTTILEDWTDRVEIGGWTNPPSNTVSFTYAGWHPIRIELYNDYGINLFELKWDAFGGVSDYVPAENLGYLPASYYGDIYDDAASAYKTASVLASAYNSAGIFKVTSKGRVKKSDGTLLAEKQITTVLKVFNTWTQTTRPELYAAWFSLYNDFSDGEIRNVTWLDSCPTDTDYLNTSLTPDRMHWEGPSYTKVSDSLKLGFWDNFDDDVAFSTVNFKGGLMTAISVPGWVQRDYGGTLYWVPTGFNWADTSWPAPENGCSHSRFQNMKGAGDTRSLEIFCEGQKEKYAEVNGSFYAPSAALGYNIFVRTWTYDRSQFCNIPLVPPPDWGTFDRSASGRKTNPEVSPPGTAAYTPKWLEPKLFMKRPAWVPAGPVTPAYMTMIKDGDGDLWGPDENELSVPGTDRNYSGPTPTIVYSRVAGGKALPYILAAVGVGAKYESFYSYQTVDGGNAAFVPVQSCNSSSSTDTGVVQLEGANMYNIYPADDVAATIAARFADFVGADSYGYHCFDNVRIIYPNGYLVSTPCVAKLSTDNSTIKWGTISWTADTPANTSMTMYIRYEKNDLSDQLDPTDTFTTVVVNSGDPLPAPAVNCTGRHIQYKAKLSTTALTATATVPNAPAVTDYQNSSATPVLRDITVTYLSPLETLYKK